MARLAPFPGWVVTPEAAPRVVAPAYDALTPAQRGAVATAEPDNFLNVMRSPEDQPAGTHLDRDELLAASRATLERLLAAGAFAPTPGPAYHVLRMRQGEHVQTGVVGTVPVGDVGTVVRLHEETREEKEQELLRHLEVVGVASSPVGLVHAGPSPVADVLDEVTRRPPTVAVASEDGLLQEVWSVTAGEELRAIADGFEELAAFYVTDGHHRAAATGRYAGGDPAVPLLAVVFPARELRVHPYHRVVHRVGGDPEAVLAALGERVAVTALDLPPDAYPPAPSRPGAALLWLAGRWYALDLGRVPRAPDPVERLDVSVLQHGVLGPVLGVTDPRTDPRLEFVPGSQGLDALCGRAGADGAGFALAPTGIDALMAVADAGATMPPKSTWFEPKVRSGLFVHAVGAGWHADRPVR